VVGGNLTDLFVRTLYSPVDLQGLEVTGPSLPVPGDIKSRGWHGSISPGKDAQVDDSPAGTRGYWAMARVSMVMVFASSSVLPVTVTVWPSWPAALSGFVMV